MHAHQQTSKKTSAKPPKIEVKTEAGRGAPTALEPRLRTKTGCSCGGGCPRCKAKALQALSSPSRAVGSILDLQRTTRNQAVQRMLQADAKSLEAGSARIVPTRSIYDSSPKCIFSTSPVQVQPKLTVSTSGDIREQEADRIAEQVMRMPEPQSRPACVCGGGCPKCQADQHRQSCNGLQTRRVSAGSADGTVVPPMAHEVARSLAEAGQPLTDPVRSYFEPRFGYDFSGVRIHTGHTANQTANALNARAYSLGNHIVFGARQYAPDTSVGRRLLAHELVHVIQQSAGRTQRRRTANKTSANGVIYRQERAPDITFRGRFTFYLPALASGGREKGFVAQFTIIDDATNTVGVKVSYRLTRHLREFQFRLPPNQTLSPSMLQQNVNAVTFDLDGDGIGDLEILLLANSGTDGIRVYVTRPGQTIGTYIIPPPRRQIVPNRGYPMGTLPNGRRYYLQPWTMHAPRGPFYVDEQGRGVNPGLEFRAAAILDTMMTSYLISLGALAAIGAGALLLPELAASAIVAGTVARGAGAIRWLFSGTRLIAGGTAAAANLATQAMEHGREWDRYNWESVGFDYVMGAVSYSVAKTVVTRWPAPLFSRQIGNLQTWVNFGKQQAVLALYGTLVGVIRARVSNTRTGATVSAQHAEGALQMAKSIGLQSFLASPAGRRLFPAGFDDPRVAFLSRSLTFIVKLSVREVFDVVPQSARSPVPARQGGQ